MTLEEAEKIRKGDALTIRAVADFLEDGMWRFQQDGKKDRKTWGWVIPEDILSVTPAPREIKVGDLVSFLAPETRQYTVLAIDGGVAWLKSPRGEHCTGMLAVLRHADATEGQVCGHTKEEWAKIGAASFARPTEVED